MHIVEMVIKCGDRVSSRREAKYIGPAYTGKSQNTMLHCVWQLSVIIQEWLFNRHVHHCTNIDPHSGYIQFRIDPDPLSGSAKKAPPWYLYAHGQLCQGLKSITCKLSEK